MYAEAEAESTEYAPKLLQRMLSIHGNGLSVYWVYAEAALVHTHYKESKMLDNDYFVAGIPAVAGVWCEILYIEFFQKTFKKKVP